MCPHQLEAVQIPKLVHMGKDQKASDLGYHKKQAESFGISNLKY